MSNFIYLDEENCVDVGDARTIDYDEAVAFGLEPQEYSREVPEGTMEVQLIFKTWGKKSSLNCFFETKDRKKYRIVAFADYKGDPYRYTPRDGGIDFSEQGIFGNIYEIEVGRTKTGYPKWISAKLIDTKV